MEEKEIKILYLYPDMLELYGDYGNIQVLKYRMEKKKYKMQNRQIFNRRCKAQFL